MQDSLVSRANEIVNLALEGKRNPVIMFSGGKDSVVMLHLLRFVLRKPFAVLFHKEPWLTHKYAFGEALIREWGCSSYDYPPSQVSLWEGKEKVAFTNYYQIGNMPDGRPACLALPKNIVEPVAGKPFACGLLDVLRRPTGTFNYPWDVVFIGHKSSDEDQIAGKVPLHSDIVENETGPRLAFPLRDWNDRDVWEYIAAHGLPWQQSRYELPEDDFGNARENPDKTFNPDYIEVCIRCIDRRNTAAEVECPMLGNKLVPNQSASVPYRDISLPYFGEHK